MKYLVVRCEDLAPASEQLAPLLEGAKLARLHELAQTGAGGLCRLDRRSPAGWMDRFGLHRTLLGGAGEAAPAGGRCYAESAEVRIGERDIVWSCDLMTQRDGVVVDPAGGRISTKESAVLIEALQSALGSDTRRWQAAEGATHLFVSRGKELDARTGAGLPPTDLLVGDPWTRHLPKGAAGAALQALLEEANAILDKHPVNRVRVDLGEDPANAVWLWGASPAAQPPTFTDRTGLSGAVISSNFVVRGLSKSLDLAWYTGPSSWEERSLQSTAESVHRLLPGRDFVYVHLAVASADPVERLCAMERLDQVLIRPWAEALPRHGAWRLMVAVDDRQQGTVPFIAAGTGVPKHPAVTLERAAFAGSPLSFTDGAGWFAWLTAGA